MFAIYADGTLIEVETATYTKDEWKFTVAVKRSGCATFYADRSEVLAVVNLGEADAVKMSVALMGQLI